MALWANSTMIIETKTVCVWKLLKPFLRILLVFIWGGVISNVLDPFYPFNASEIFDYVILMAK